ncbi:MAG: diguanylate cyclase [Defluviimonas sp.]|nr:diguanylate cyclase [Defluviimonas sp.]
MAGKILIVDDVATNRIVLKVKLASACYDTLQAANGTEALRLARSARPDLILLDVQLPDMDGIAVCTALKADPLTRAIPVVMVSAFRDPASKLQALEAGVDEFLSKPLDEVVLLARLRSLLRARETEEELRLRDSTSRELGFAEMAEGFDAPGTIALVAARRETALAWKRDLAPHMPDRLLVLDREDVLAETLPAAGQPAPDLFLLAADLAQPGEGLRLMSELRSRGGTRHAAICIALPPQAPETAAMALDLGASDVIAATACPAEIALRLRGQIRRKRQADRLRAQVADGLRMAVIDPLTGLYNRRYALPHLARIAERARQTGRHFALMLLDLDRFKLVNDGWGHAAGDAVLVEVAERLRSNLRAVDLVARLGGEEFLVAMPDTRLEAGRHAAERLRRVIEERAVVLPNGQGAVPVTVSIGLAIGGGPRSAGAHLDELMGRADHALLDSKAEGRNLVTISRPAA